MDLIYTDNKRIPMGILKDYKLDLAYGSDENNFELTMLLDAHCCQEDGLLYIPETEYGGIIDKICPDTRNNTIKYKGRTWHGIIASKIVEAEENGTSFDISSLDANKALWVVINHVGLGDLFNVNLSETGLLVSHSDSNVDAYTYIVDMLKTENGEPLGKLKMQWNESWNVIDIHVETASNYTAEDEFDSSLVAFSVEKNYNLPNHYILLKKDEDGDKKIHLFLDDEGLLQQYVKSQLFTPFEDEHYITNKSQQVITGSKEITKLIESSASALTSYIPLTTIPSDWKKGYVNYFKKSIDVDDEGVTKETYTQLERSSSDDYVQLMNEPYDWNVAADRYYEVDYNDDGSVKYDDDGNVMYKSVGTVAGERYTIVSKQPVDWKTNYSNYYYVVRTQPTTEYASCEGTTKDYYEKVKFEAVRNWNLTYNNYFILKEGKYESLSAVSYDVYIKLSKKPKDWATNWKKYYILASGGYTTVGTSIWYKDFRDAPTFQKGKFYKAEKRYKAPSINLVLEGKVYVKTRTEYIAPSFNKYDNVWMKIQTDTSPTFEPRKYYRIVKDVDIGIPFVEGGFYRQAVDNYGPMIDDAIKQINEDYSADKIDIALLSDEDIYDIGDLVEAVEHTTGIHAIQPITKKIVVVEKDKVTVNYSVSSK